MRTLLLALVLAAPARAAPLFAWPAPELISRVEVPGRVDALGVPVRLRLLRLKLKPDALWPIYADAFRKAGLFIPPRKRQVALAGVPMLTAFDPRRRISYSVALWENADGTTSALLGEANLALRRKDYGAAFAPVIPGGEGVFVSTQEGARVMTYRTRAAEAEVSRFYAEELGRAGYVRGESGEFLRGDEVLSVQLRPEKDQPAWVAIVQRLGESAR